MNACKELDLIQRKSYLLNFIMFSDKRSFSFNGKVRKVNKFMRSALL